MRIQRRQHTVCRTISMIALFGCCYVALADPVLGQEQDGALPAPLPKHAREGGRPAPESGSSDGSDLFFAPRFVPLTPHETSTQPVLKALYSDRREYWADDLVAQFVVSFQQRPQIPPDGRLRLELQQNGRVDSAATFEVSPLETPKFAFLLDLSRLEIGTHAVRALLFDAEGREQASVSCRFAKTVQRHSKASLSPEGIPILVAPQSNEATISWPITTGVPLPWGLSKDPQEFTLYENGVQVPVQVVTRATWQPIEAGRAVHLKWIGLDFLARYDGGKPRQYRLRQEPTGRTLSTKLTWEQDETRITIDTGVIRFEVMRKPFSGIRARRNAGDEAGTALIEDRRGG